MSKSERIDFLFKYQSCGFKIEKYIPNICFSNEIHCVIEFQHQSH